MEELESALTHTVLVAPFDGHITALSATAGRTVNAGDLIGVIADVSQIEISANLRENQMQQLAEGMAASIAPPNPTGEPLTGIVRQLPYPYGSGEDMNASNADTSVRISFDQHDQALDLFELGERASLQVVITERPDALWLPPAAIREFSGRTFVVVQIDEVQQRVDITLGITGDGRVEIMDGLAEGQTIIGQ
jgi:membrane fusion protein (multidrug efflux system)